MFRPITSLMTALHIDFAAVGLLSRRQDIHLQTYFAIWR